MTMIYCENNAIDNYFTTNDVSIHIYGIVIKTVFTDN